MHVHNERNFPLAKLDREIDFFFLLNEQDDLYFLLLNDSVHIIFNLKKFKKFLSQGKKDIGESVQKQCTLECKLQPCETHQQ